jgi:ElaB/YqjD/DUF883 family membrane-anchored ribosome-binding protein
MANLEDEVTGRTGSNVYAGDEDNGPSSREIRREIERTRSQMDRNLDALEQKLTPSQLALEAWSLFRGGSTAGASRLWRIAKQHPGPAAVIGVGLAWLMTDSSRNSGDAGDIGDMGDYRRDYGPRYEGAYGYGRRGYSDNAGTGYGFSSDWEGEDHEGRLSSALHGAKEKVSSAADTAKHAVGDAASTAKHAVSDAASTAKDTVTGAKERVVDATSAARERASELGGQARERARYQARQAQMGFWQSMEERPLAIGAAALALGVVAGLMVPSTRKEDELMGETRDRLMGRAKEVGEEALEKGKQVASAAVDTLKEEAERQDLTPEKLAEKVRTLATEATNKVKEEGRKQATELKESVVGETPGPSTGIPAAPVQDRQSELTPK